MQQSVQKKKRGFFTYVFYFFGAALIGVVGSAILIPRPVPQWEMPVSKNAQTEVKEISAEERRRNAFRAINRDRESMFAYSFCKGQVEATLRSPDSADFPWAPRSVVINDREGQFSIVSYVDARNAFSAGVRHGFVCILHYEGGGPDGWSLVELSWL